MILITISEIQLHQVLLLNRTNIVTIIPTKHLMVCVCGGVTKASRYTE